MSLPKTTADLSGKSKDELINLALTAGVNLDGSERADKLRKLIAEKLGLPEAASTAENKGEAAITPDNMNATLKALRGQDKVRIMIHQSERARDHVPVSVNGVQYLIKVGVAVDVPRSVYEVLNNARETRFHDNEQTKQKESMEVLSYPFTRVTRDMEGLGVAA